MKEAVLKVAALFSYCGGPLYIADLLKPGHNTALVFGMTFLPILMMVLGAFCLEDDTRSRWSSSAVGVGRLGLAIVLVMNLYTVSCFVQGVRVPDQFLHDIGIAVGMGWSIAYWHAARRWVSSPGAPSEREDRASTDPIEPS